MTYSYVQYTYTSGTPTFVVPFDYLDEDYVSVYIDGVLTTGYTWPSSSSIQLTANPAAGSTVLIRRDTEKANKLVDFTNTSSLDETNLDNNTDQMLNLIQETVDSVLKSTGGNLDYQAGNKKIQGLMNGVSGQDAATISQVAAIYRADHTGSYTADGVQIYAQDLSNGDYNTSDLNTIISSFGSSNVILLLKENWTIDNNVTFPANVIVKFLNGALLTISTGKTVTFTSSIEANKSIQIFTGSGASGVRFSSNSNNVLFPEWWGADPSTSDDDTAAVQNCFTVARASTGRIVSFGVGTYKVSSAGLTETSGSIYIKIVGAGRGLTTISKYGTSTDPVLFFGTGTMGEWFGDISEMSIQGINTCTGLRLNGLYSFKLDTLDIRYCLKAIENNGSLVFCLDNCYIEGNTTGLYNRKSAYNVYANLIKINNSSFMWNTTFGIDHSEGSQVNINGGQFEGNGTAGNYSTGGVMIRSETDNETGFAAVIIDGCHFESNNGWGIQTESGCTGLKLALRDMHNMSHDMVNNPSGGVLKVLSSNYLTLENLSCGTTSMPFSIAGTTFSYVVNCQIASITDTSTYKTYLNNQIALGAYESSYGFLTDVNINNAHCINFLYDQARRNNKIWVDTVTNGWTNPTLTVTPYNNGYFTVEGGVTVKNSKHFYAEGGLYNQSHLCIGVYHIWVDDTGRLRIKNGAPTSHTDGTVIGTQT